MADKEWPDNEPLWRALYDAAGNWWRSFVICWSCYGPWDRYRQRRNGYGYHIQPWWAVVVGFPLAVNFASLQAYGHVGLRKGWPKWPWRVFAAVEDFLGDLIRAHTQEFVWLPADSGDPNEVAFHCRIEDVERVRGEDGKWRYVKRPRMYCYASVVPTIPQGQHTVTAGSGYTYMFKIDEVPHA